METTCLSYLLTDDERREFDTRGYFVLPEVLSPEWVSRLTEAADRVGTEHRARQGLAPHARLSVMDFVGLDDAFLELVDWPVTFPKVWGILGWNIQLYHSHLVVTPPEPAADGPRNLQLSWHQDSARLNRELEGDPRPRVSLKVAFFLTDTSEPGRGNFYVVPGSHLRNEIEFPGGDRSAELAEGVPVLAPRGAAVFFDRRIWHSVSANFWTEPRKALFYGYSYRWLRPRDDMTVARHWDRLDPVRRQLFGAAPTGGYGYTSPTDEDVPLRTWIRDHVGEHAVAP